MTETRVAVVTGVTSGVGRGLARALCAGGFAVVGVGRRVELGATLECEVRDAGGELVYVAADIRAVSDCERIVDVAVSSYGRLDLLVNNAGTVGDPAVCDSHRVDETTWDAIVDTNLKGAFFCARYALPTMLEQGGGSIINISSAMGLNIGPAGMAAYTASKAALIALTKTLAVEYADRGIRVNAIVLGGAEGETAHRVRAALVAVAASEGESPRPDVVSGGRITGEELAVTVLYLCSPGARHVNGAALPVDDGVTAGLATAQLARPSPNGRATR